MHVCMYGLMHVLYAGMYCIYVYIQTMYVCMYVYIDTYKLYMYVRIRICACLHQCVCVCVVFMAHTSTVPFTSLAWVRKQVLFFALNLFGLLSKYANHHPANSNSSSFVK
jgi:hypothetical protein